MALENLVGMNTFMLLLASIVTVTVYEFLSKKIPDIWSTGKGEWKFSIGKGISMLVSLFVVSWLAGAVM